MNFKANQTFLEELKMLNPAQKNAVESIEGPVMVIAGPGTGKTQILAARIGNILMETDVYPENILCLTYTDAGAVAMRKRLNKFIGPDAYRVNIGTFHAFCNQVIQDHPDVFGYRELEALSELEEVELLMELIKNFDNDHPLKRWTGDVYYERKRLQALFQTMKKEDWTYDFLKQKAETYLEDLPNREEYIYKRKTKTAEKGDLKQDKIDKEQEKMEKLLAGAAELENYEKLKAEKGRYDFNDMLLWVINAFKENATLLAEYQERYQYVLVDEFQDCNGAQNELLNQLIDYWDNPNVFVVGDDDQSIFRFQGASVENIMHFRADYEASLKLIMMTENYRSSQKILDAAGHLIANNSERLINEVPNLSKDLKARAIEFSNSEVRPVLRTYPNMAQEIAHICLEIKTLKEQGVNLNEVAVIYAKHSQAEELIKYMNHLEVPLNVKRRENILDSVFIKKVLDILEYISEEIRVPFSRGDMLFKILHFDFFGLNPLEIAEQVAENRTNYKKSLRKVLADLPASKAPDLFSAPIRSEERLKQTAAMLEGFIRDSQNLTLQSLFEKIISKGGILKYVVQSPYKFDLMQELSTLFEFIKELTLRDSKAHLPELFDTIRKLQDNKIALSVQKIQQSESGINLLTCHASKGLEFKYVYMIGVHSSNWEKKRGGNQNFSFPDNLAAGQKDSDRDEQDLRRLFYVAMTRAKEHLYISYPEYDLNDKELEQSRFIAELQQGDCLKEERPSLSPDALLEFKMKVLEENPLPDIKLIEKDRLQKILEKYTLSITHLNTFLKCPRSFYYKYMLKVPAAKNQHMAFGSAVHYALERLFKDMQDSKADQFPAKADMLKYFDWYMQKHRDSFTDEQYEDKKNYGHKLLPEYYDHYIDEWNKVVSVERSIKGVESEGVPLNGKLDKLEFSGEMVNVVDYKTGQYDKSRKKKRFDSPKEEWKDPENPTHEEKYGGDYWRQAVFYKILVDEFVKNDLDKNWKVLSSEFDFVEPDSKTGDFHKEKIPITDEAVKIVKSQIKSAYERIVALDFQHGCEEEYCEWCNFTKSHFTELKTAEAPEEELEERLPEGGE
ncbi:MAG: ATP-dependent DNA helicase [Chitinophagales bacterium]